MCETLECASLTVDVMLVVLEVWQAILVKKLDLDSSWVKQSMSEGARNLLKVGLPCPFFTPSLPLHPACLLSLFPLLHFGYLLDGVCYDWCRFESVLEPVLKVCPFMLILLVFCPVSFLAVNMLSWQSSPWQKRAKS